MIPMKVAHATTPAQRVVPAQLHPGSQQALTRRRCQSRRTVGIEQAAHPHATGSGPAQRVDQALAALAILDQVQLHLHLLRGCGDRGQHAREEHRAIEQ